MKIGISQFVLPTAEIVMDKPASFFYNNDNNYQNKSLMSLRVRSTYL
jgi:hypothetical protein